MFFIIPIFIVCFLIFLYNLYLTSSDDFVITREDISMHKIFNTAFLVAFFSIIFSRIFFILFSMNSKFFNLFGFLAFTYFPGFSLIGGILGAFISIVVYCRIKKYPTGKIADLFSRAFLGVLPIGFLFMFIALLAKTSFIFNILFISSFIMSIIFIKPIYKLSEKGEIKDGSFSLIFISVFSFIYFLIKLFTDINNFNFFNFENIILFVAIFSSLILLINQEVIEKMIEKK